MQKLFLQRANVFFIKVKQHSWQSLLMYSINCVKVNVLALTVHIFFKKASQEVYALGCTFRLLSILPWFSIISSYTLHLKWSQSIKLFKSMHFLHLNHSVRPLIIWFSCCLSPPLLQSLSAFMSGLPSGATLWPLCVITALTDWWLCCRAPPGLQFFSVTLTLLQILHAKRWQMPMCAVLGFTARHCN